MNSAPAATPAPDGLLLFVKRECETCALVTPLIPSLPIAALYVQDDPQAFAAFRPIDDISLEQAFHFNIETVPTLLRIEGGREVARAEGWVREEWRSMTGFATLGDGLPARQPGWRAGSPLPSVAMPVMLRHSSRTQPSARATSRPPSMRSKVGTVSMLK